MAGAYAAYAIACIDCEQAALFRTPYSIPGQLRAVPRTSSNKAMIPRDGFAACQNDRVLLTLCHDCEKARGEHYGLNFTINIPSSHPHARLAHPDLSASLVRAWPLVDRLARWLNMPVVLDPSDDSRPVIKIELLSHVLINSNNTNFKYIGTVNDDNERVDNRQIFFMVQT